MHENKLSPIKTVRFVIPALVVVLVLLILSYTLPFYSYIYFSLGRTMNFFECANASTQMYFPIVGSIVAFVFAVAALIIFLFKKENKILNFISKLLCLLSAFIFLALFIIALCRLWVIPYEFSYDAVQTLEVGYVVYLFTTLIAGFISCYFLALHEK